MKKRYVPLLAALVAAAFVLGLSLGAGAQDAGPAEGPPGPAGHGMAIAVVNADAGIIVDGALYNYSSAIIDTLGEGFVLVSPAMAQAGLASGAYSAVITFPSNVSERVLSFNARVPERVRLDIQMSGGLTESEFVGTYTAIMDLQLAINTALASTYVSSILRQFHHAQDQLEFVFQNNLADLKAVETIALGDFTASLELDEIPFVPIRPNELDTPFYMEHVRAFAEEVAAWYLDSYRMASNQFLWMREGLFSLTDDFRHQEDSWVGTLVAWTRYSEFYGEMLDKFFEDVSGHEDGLRGWHALTANWSRELHAYQRSVMAWHEDSEGWHFDAWQWHAEYREFLRRLEEYAETLVRHHEDLEGSLEPVMLDLANWRDALMAYESGLRAQHYTFIGMTRAYDEQASIANLFLSYLLTWHEGLHAHHGELAYWLGGLIDKHVALYAWRGKLHGIHYDFGEAFAMLAEGLRVLDIENVPALPEIEPPEAPPALASPPDLRYGPEIEHLDDKIDGISESLYLLLFGLSEMYLNLESAFEGFGDLELDIGGAMSDMDGIYAMLAEIMDGLDEASRNLNGTAELRHMSVPDMPAAQQPVFAPAFTTGAAMTAVFHAPAQPQADAAWLEEEVARLNQSIAEANEWMALLRDHYLPLLEASTSGVQEQKKALLESAQEIEGFASLAASLAGSLQEQREELAGHVGTMNINLANFQYCMELLTYFACVQGRNSGLLGSWHGGLMDGHDAILLWQGEAEKFQGELLELHGSVQAHAWGLAGARAGMLEAAGIMTGADLPDLHCLYWLGAQEIPPAASGPAPAIVGPIEREWLPEWDENIAAPREYDGRQLHEAFNVSFPLREDQIRVDMELARPPQLEGYQAPEEVGEMPMLMAGRPESPLIPPPPRPDDFWHSLNYMHGQLLEFDVDEFLSYDVLRQVDASLESYQDFLETVRQDLNLLFEGNIWMMHDVNSEYNRFLNALRHEAHAAARHEQELLQSAIGQFMATREATNENTLERLVGFAEMMPESRAASGVNQQLVDFVAMPFEFAPPHGRGEARAAPQQGGPAAPGTAHGLALLLSLLALGLVFAGTMASLIFKRDGKGNGADG